MKKLIFAAFAAGAMVLAGCTKTEVTKVSESRAIGFDNFVSNSVKSITSEQDLTNFYVFGGYDADNQIFGNTQVSSADQGATWTYSPDRFWIADKTAYKFAAYSDEKAAIGTADTYDASTVAFDYVSGHLTINSYSTDGTKDLVYGLTEKPTYSGAAPETVKFTFYHALSKVVFKFTKDASLDDINVAIADLKIGQITTSCKFEGAAVTGNQLPYTVWDRTDATTNDQNVAFENPTISTNGASLSSTPLFLIPQGTDTPLKISFKLTPSTENNIPTGLEEKTFPSVELPATNENQWKPGFSYIYTATISAATFDANAIVFDVISVQAFDTDTDIPLEDENFTLGN